MEIFVLQAGWTVVGEARREGDTLIIERAAVVRRWGTTRGLGELADRGPLPNTHLDKAPHAIRAHPLSVILSFPCGPAWDTVDL